MHTGRKSVSSCQCVLKTLSKQGSNGNPCFEIFLMEMPLWGTVESLPVWAEIHVASFLGEAKQ